nr:hypothetical protein EUTSA_v10023769mg [Ipomoea batatas]GME05311.1 hypothetical protein EUTSA_v10023769mg [Ipomoea batatas]
MRVRMCLRSEMTTKPEESLSRTLNASRSWRSKGSGLRCFDMRSRKRLKSKGEVSFSSATMDLSCAWVGFPPRDLIKIPSSVGAILPSPSVSNSDIIGGRRGFGITYRPRVSVSNASRSVETFPRKVGSGRDWGRRTLTSIVRLLSWWFRSLRINTGIICIFIVFLAICMLQNIKGISLRNFWDSLMRTIAVTISPVRGAGFSGNKHPGTIFPSRRSTNGGRL